MFQKTNVIGLIGLASVAYAWPTTTCTEEGATPTAPASSSLPSCWETCFQQAGVKSEQDLCGNTAVDACIQDGCSADLDKQYWDWYDGFCGTTTSPVSPPTTTPAPPTTTPPPPTTTPVSPTSPTTTPSIPTPPTGTPFPQCWQDAFTAANITSKSELCGNTAVDQYIQDNCTPEEDKAYWDWYLSFCPATTSPTSPVTTPTTTPASPTSPTTTPATPTSPTTTTPSTCGTPTATPSCWTACFTENNVTSEAALEGNTAVDKCIQDTCSAADDKAYWDWYDCFFPSTTTPTGPTGPATTPTGPATTPSGPATTTTPALPTGTPSCWNTCFTSNNVTSEAQLCGDDAVTSCINDSCPADSAAQYQSWLDSFCGYDATTVVTVTTPCSTWTSGGSTFTSVPVTPVSPTTGLPTITPAYPTGPATGAVPPPSGTGAPVPPTTPSAPIVPPTGAGVMNKPALAVVAIVVGVAALF